MAISFSEISPALSSGVLEAIEQDFQFKQMTPVQASTIPLFLRNKDVCVEATTGSGKTLAFGIPIIELLLRRSKERGKAMMDEEDSDDGEDGDKKNRVGWKKHEVGALIVAPSRELASQINEVMSVLITRQPEFTCSLFVGGVHISEHINDFRENGGNIVIGTPGRILGMLNRCDVFILKAIEVLVLDEADTLLDMGFRDNLNDILSKMPKQRRTGLFSATQTSEVKDLARAGMRNPVSVVVKVQKQAPSANKSSNEGEDEEADNEVKTTSMSSTSSTPSTLSNYFSVCEHDQRPGELFAFLRKHSTAKVIVFCATCSCVDYYTYVFHQIMKMADIAEGEGLEQKKTNKEEYFKVLGMHGKQVPKKRNAIYKNFVSISKGVMFSTDVAARGIDIPDVDWIIQMAAPKDPAFFVHRVGRTARAGRTGGAILLVSHEEKVYIDLLRRRGVPLVERKRDTKGVQSASKLLLSTKSPDAETKESALYTDPVLEAMKAVAMVDRSALEMGSTAFMAFLRSYKEHLCSYIFRLDKLDLGCVARSYALLRLPKIPETRSVIGDKINFDLTYIDTSTIAYKHKEKEIARKKKLKALKAKQKEEEEKLQRELDEKYGTLSSNDDFNNDNSDNDNGGSDDEDGDDADSDVAVSVKTKGTKGTFKSNKSSRSVVTLNKRGFEKKEWVPADQYVAEDLKRKRKKKQSFVQKVSNEWDDFASEEAAYKKYKKGKITKQQYDDFLLQQEGGDDVDIGLAEVRGMDGLMKEVKGHHDDGSGESDGDEDGFPDGGKKKDWRKRKGNGKRRIK